MFIWIGVTVPKYKIVFIASTEVGIHLEATNKSSLSFGLDVDLGFYEWGLKR